MPAGIWLRAVIILADLKHTAGAIVNVVHLIAQVRYILIGLIQLRTIDSIGAGVAYLTVLHIRDFQATGIDTAAGDTRTVGNAHAVSAISGATRISGINDRQTVFGQ